jgi:hypothetical protein
VKARRNFEPEDGGDMLLGNADRVSEDCYYKCLFVTGFHASLKERTGSVYSDSSFCDLVVKVPGYRPTAPWFECRLPDFLRSNGSGTGSTQPREYN